MSWSEHTSSGSKSGITPDFRATVPDTARTMPSAARSIASAPPPESFAALSAFS